MKWEVGIQTVPWYREKDPEGSLRYIRECGFDGVDYNMNQLFTDTFDQKELTSFFDRSLEELKAYYASLKRASEVTGVAISLVHSLFPVWTPDEEEPGASARNQYRLELTKKMIALCGYLGCRYLVVHPNRYPELTQQAQRQINLQMYRQLIDAAKTSGVVICLENLPKHEGIRQVEGVCSETDEVRFYIDTLNAEAGQECFGLCLDTGHAMILGKNLYQFVTAVGSRLKVLHLHENNGVSDCHMLPYTQLDLAGQRGIQNWDEFLRGLHEIGYEGPISFETFHVTVSMPKSLWASALRLTCDVGRYWRGRLENWE